MHRDTQEYCYFGVCAQNVPFIKSDSFDLSNHPQQVFFVSLPNFFITKNYSHILEEFINSYTALCKNS